jgi:glycosyltransferase involved in cell wall biosynthesis
MKIVIFDSVSDLYGSSRICRLIIKILRENGNEISAFVNVETLPESCRYGKEIDFPMLVFSFLKRTPIKYLFNLFKSYCKFREEANLILADANLIYCNTFATLPVAMFCKLRGYSTVLHLHETASGWFMSSLGRYIIPKIVDRVICVSEAVAISWGISSNPKMTIVYNGIPDLVESEIAMLDQDRKYDICFVGRLTAKKGIKVFISAIKELSHSASYNNKNILNVAIAGGALFNEEIPAELKNFINRENLVIHYLGEIENPSQVFLQSKVACIPSLFHDPFPTVVLEAMRAGCSLVATNLGGAKEAVGDAVGELVVPGDIVALAAAMERQLTNWSLISVYKNRSLFINRFTYDKFKKSLLSLDIIKGYSH